MPIYLSPGVYVEEIASGSAPIAALGTSTAGFIGIVPDEVIVPISPPLKVTDSFMGTGDKKTFELTNYPVNLNADVEVIVTDTNSAASYYKKPEEVAGNKEKAQVTLDSAPSSTERIEITYFVKAVRVTNEEISKESKGTELPIQKWKDGLKLKYYPVQEDNESWEIKINGTKIPDDAANLEIKQNEMTRSSKVTIDPVVNKEFWKSYKKKPNSQGEPDATSEESISIVANYKRLYPKFRPIAEAQEVKLCTNFNEFKKYFGDYSLDDNQKKLAHAVYGFFNNGGSRCYVSRVTDEAKIPDVLEQFEAIDEIAIVAAPGITDKPTRSAIVTHCQRMGDRFAILDCDPNKKSSDVKDDKPDNSDYAAYYFPWIKVSDPTKRIMNPDAKSEELFIPVPPSGHIAGVYARVDGQRGVHKAPANEVIFGALGLERKISKSQQDGLNPQGINCIRELNGNIRIWGARTVGGDANGEFKYINVRRLFLSLKDSIEKGTQWTVFEPNDAELWAKIRRNVNAYLTNVWRSGALFGATPQEAFFVKCDAENNPPEVRDLGQVVIEIGVAPVKPAEFVIFRLSQWTGSGQ